MHNLPRLGWLVTDTGNPDHPYRIEADPDVVMHRDGLENLEAAQYVARNAANGEPQAIAAIRWLKVNSPAEVEAIKKLVNRKTAERIDSL